jgi:porin
MWLVDPGPVPHPASLAPFVAALIITLASAAPASEWRDGLLGRERLSGDWASWRQRIEARGLTLEAVYTGDVVSTVVGGLRRRTRYLDNADVTLTLRTAEAVAVDTGTLFVYGVGNQGGDPSSDVGDVQGVNNIEAPDSFKLYEAWWQRVFLDRVSILAGLYDLNSEFDVIESAALFIHSSFGIGAEYALSGINGPPIFPLTALGARIKVAPLDFLLVQAAVLDGVPGSLRDDRGTQIVLADDDGLLIATEAAFVWDEVDAASEGMAETAMRGTRRRRIGRGWGEIPHALKVAIGSWVYSKDLERLDRAAGTTKQAHPGLYASFDVDAAWLGFAPWEGLSFFARAGIADEEVQQVGAYLGGGLVYAGLLPGRADDRFGAAVAAAHNGSPFRHASGAAGERAAAWETALEWTYRTQLTPWLALQPDVQYVLDPGGLHPDALVLGLRTEVAF